jgi:hypothetical protein
MEEEDVDSIMWEPSDGAAAAECAASLMHRAMHSRMSAGGKQQGVDTADS